MADDAPKDPRLNKYKSNWFTDFCRWVEHKTLIPLIEGLMRIWFRLDPRVYSLRLRIKAVTKGNVAKKSDRYVVFVVYTKGPLPSFTLNLIEAIQRSPLNLVIVSNVKLDLSARTQLLDRCHLLIERSNIGRDFGGYKDAICILWSQNLNIDRLVLINDSLFFFKDGLDRILGELDGDHEFIGLTEVFEYHYHVQSFMLSFGPQAVRHKRFHRYWRKYRPITTRRWAIHKGEVGLTRHMTKAGFRPHILFHGAQLIAKFRDRSIGELFDAIELLPNAFRPQMYEDSINIYERYVGQSMGPIGATHIGQPVSPINAMFEVARRLRFGKGDDADLADQRDASIQQLQRLSERTTAMDKLALEAVWQEIVSTIATRNQIHVGGFLFMKYLGLPVIKRDIFYREVYALEDIYRILGEFGEPLREEVMADLRRGGTAANLKGFLKLLHRHGSV